jgi:outer membrane protein OmpA-like peptidoglycan-associated protein
MPAIRDQPEARRIAMQRRILTFLALSGLAACAGLQTEPEPTRVVFFQGESATLDGPARAVVQAAAGPARSQPVTILGYGGPTGGNFNRTLAVARAQHVAELLRQAGVPAERITVQTRAPVPADMAPIETRRVEIRFAAP